MGLGLLALSLSVLTEQGPSEPLSGQEIRSQASPAPVGVDRLQLVDGQVLSGRVLGRAATHVTLALPDGQVVLVPRERLAREEPAARAAEREPARRLRLRSGREVEGWILRKDDLTCELRLANGTVVTLEAQELVE
jgi:hypothetical protein